ncbi:MAG: hypothetical protein KJ930_08525 [Gammaproteobacteria bacterium]|nr:hypothetical protein [Gammaproteobacteria bacterium]MBU2426235.1 hypothetical protein [Gammaproteobacteria bacterium]
MSMRINCQLYLKQSRLAGFFLCCALLLVACSEPAAPTDNFSLLQAKRAEQQGLVSLALPLYQKAAQQGDVAAVSAVMRLQIPNVGVAALGEWLQRLPLSSQQKQPFLAQLGLWQQVPADAALLYQQRWHNSILHQSLQPQSQCALYLQPVLTTQQSALQWVQLQQQWRKDSQLSSLAICFQAPIYVDSQILGCSEQRAERIQCNVKPLASLVLQSDVTHLLVIAGQGGASYNNGWLQLPENATLPLLRHELSHLFGFMDEYPLAKAIAGSECVPGRITPNLLFSKNDLPAYLAKWRLKHSDIQLTAVDSCKHTSQQAYRVVAADSHLQYYELPMPDLYLELMQQQLRQPSQLMPVAYYFAYLARQQQEWDRWQQLMRRAASSGYPPAQQALTEASGSGVGRTIR